MSKNPVSSNSSSKAKDEDIRLEPYSALMPVYCKETPEHFEMAMESIFAQTVPPDEFVLVCDGPLTAELNELIERKRREHPSLKVLRLPENKGAAVAFEEGSKTCAHDLIQKFGSDDYCRPERAELQLRKYAEDPSLAVVGGFTQVFHDTPGDSDAVRIVPCDQDAILSFARRRNPFNDGTVMYRKSAFQAVGGYSPELVRAQDYDVYVRILAAGYRACNIPMILADGREDRDAIRRRRTWSHFKCFVAVRWRIHKSGFNSLADFIIPCAAQLAMLIVPPKACLWIYRKALRTDASELS